MKKLKLYGERKWFFGITTKGFIADLYVANGKVIIDTKSPKLRAALKTALDESFRKGLVVRIKGVWEQLPGPAKRHYHNLEHVTPTDARFLETVWWQVISRWENQTFAGYKILPNASVILEE